VLNQASLHDTGVARKRLSIAPWWMIAALVFISAVPIILSPTFWTQVPGRDSGVFLYIGSAILRGEVPYRDVWDHKGPLIYFIDALGLQLGGGSQWGVHLLEWVSLSVATLAGYGTMRRMFGKFPALCASALWIFSLVVLLQGGNFTEEYALPLQFGALRLFARGGEDDTLFLRWFGIGFTGSLVFLLRQNLIGVWVSLILYIVIEFVTQHKWLVLWKRLLALMLGAFLPVALAVLYLGLQNALPDFWSQYFLYNLAYSGTTMGARIGSMLAGIEITSITGLFLFAVAGWILLIIRKLRSRGAPDQKGSMASNFSLMLLILLPVELLFSSLSGNTYIHYYMTLLPALVMLAAFAISAVPPKRETSGRRLLSTQSLLVTLVVAMCLGYTVDSVRQILKQTSEPDAVQQTAQYVSASTGKDETVLMWGASATVNYLSDRLSPTRYIYQLPLYNSAYSTVEMVNEFYRDIAENEPVLIIDASEDIWDVPGHLALTAVEPSGAPGPAEAASASRLDDVVSYISAHYCPVTEIGVAKWPVYRLCK
jgi:4-amino-4-deoxy-L-arabinose transferase-like glycosyltransferase